MQKKCYVDCLNTKRSKLEKVTQSLKVSKVCQTKKSAKKISRKSSKTLCDFIWAQRFLHATVSVIYMFRPSFYNLLNMTFWMKTCPCRSSHQTVFFYTSALKTWAKRLKVNGEVFFSNLKEFVCSFTKNELLCIYLPKFFLCKFYIT